METWVAFTLLAAVMQAVRTAGQKQLSGQLSAMATTGVRYIFALPFAIAYLVWLLDYRQQSLPVLNDQFIRYALIASVMQIVGTVCLVIAFRYRNFAVATSLSKTEAIWVAIVGTLVFASSLSYLGWISVIIGVVGVILLTKVRFTVADLFRNPGAGFGLASGLGLAITTLLIRESSLALDTDLMVSAAVTLVFMISMQCTLSISYLAFSNRQQFKAMLVNWRLCLFVGITSVIGSIGWFTGASYQNAAYVKALGQIEFFITLMLTYRLFKEKISLKEYVGMALVLASVIILLLWA
ncbi:DMT family transporter [Thalassotalea ganghwensis]